MYWHDEFESALPPPRDDEPANLRCDIADELADHLECAMQRELRSTDDANQARSNVLARFGNPHRIARQLWLDSMKGRIMTQRILIATNVILAVATIAVAVFAVSVVRESRQFQAGLVAELRTTMGQMLDERTVVLAAQPTGVNAAPVAAAAPEVPPAVVDETDDDPHERSSQHLAELTDNWRAAFAAGNELLSLPPEQGIAILRENWQRIEHVSSRQQIIKAFAFSVMQDLHPHMIDVMHLGMTDESPEVQTWAMGYLKWMAFEDFAKDFAGYERWRERHEDRPQQEVMVASLNDWVNRLEAGDESATALLRERSMLSLRDQPFMREAAQNIGLPMVLEPLVQPAAEPRATQQQVATVKGALARIGEMKPDEAYMRRVILPIVSAGTTSPVFTEALFTLEGEQHAWARDILLEMLHEVVLRPQRDMTGDVFTLARVLASYRDPSLIPHFIALVAANNTYETVYGIGWFGLNPLTGVGYDETHDGEWWKQWWNENRQRYPEPARSMAIPDLGAASAGRDDAASSDIRSAGGNEHMRYRLYGSDADSPEYGYKLIVVLPGGDGSDDFRFFVGEIQEQALPEGYLLAQLIAPVWDPNQPERVVWPTQGLKWPTMQFSTEQFIEAVIDDIAETHELNERHIYALGWSSGGPPVYATAMQEQTRLSGAFVIMSVFHPQQYSPAENAKGRAFYILHSPDDFIAMRFPEQAVQTLTAAGASATLQTYDGGHGWHGDVFGMIRHGIEWLEQAGQSPKAPASHSSSTGGD